MKKGLNRRNFIKNSALGVIGGTLANRSLIGIEEKAQVEKKKDPVVKDYRVLGRTGFKVSDISLGYSGNAQVIRKALESGVNYIDSAESYKNQKVVGEAIKSVERNKVFVTSKLEIKKDKSEAGFIKRFNQCLKELDTDYIDCMMIHSAESIEILKTPGFHSAMDKMKKEGKLRFVGVSNHGGNWFTEAKVPMATILNEAVKDGRFDVFLLAYNFIQEDLGAEVIENCNKAGIGVTLMKVNPVGSYYKIRDRIKKLESEGKKVHPLYREGIVRFKKKAESAEEFIEKYDLKNPKDIKNAAVKFVLSNKSVNTVACGMRNFDNVEEFLSLSGQVLTEPEKKQLSYYKEGPGQLYCRHGCNECESSCPEELKISDIMRYNHYYDAHLREKYAIKKYLSLNGKDARLCADCEGYCESSCSYELPVQGLLSMAHNNLSLG